MCRRRHRHPGRTQTIPVDPCPKVPRRRHRRRLHTLYTDIVCTVSPRSRVQQRRRASLFCVLLSRFSGSGLSCCPLRACSRAQSTCAVSFRARSLSSQVAVVVVGCPRFAISFACVLFPARPHLRRRRSSAPDMHTCLGWLAGSWRVVGDRGAEFAACLGARVVENVCGVGVSLYECVIERLNE